ncbi:metal ABC transporter permease [Ostreibacterium oceani]|uniref:Iron chelate uptake ABC transporter family permease subunit n=1 Tax=Ostreibacterium oceani TaxID=2654998 RepID=A0A6N7EV89_9GAMM|nr:metal ABC transporter permease [Ostreibacterium oceani]MPV85349.1 iron chelate uptake ABC transporter family permease subunit [Ostreibacterium oceani]
MLEALFLLLTDYSLRVILLGVLMMGLLSGALGCFTLLKSESLLGDAISHAALPGIVLAFIITGDKSANILFVGALASGVVASLWILSIVQTRRLKTDAALGIALSVFFGLGIVLLSLVQKQGNAGQSGLERYLFGQAATLLAQDVLFMALWCGLAILVLLLIWKEAKLVVFDPDYAQTLGFHSHWLRLLLTSLTVIAIVIGLQSVGVVLMSAMLIAPAATARQWTNRLGTMVMLSAVFGGLAGILGVAFSVTIDNTPTGPAIVLVATLFALITFIIAPNRGIAARYWQRRKNQRQILASQLLFTLYQQMQPNQPATSVFIQHFSKSTYQHLEKTGAIAQQADGWQLTAYGKSIIDEWINAEQANCAAPKPLIIGNHQS